jgi:exo-beta-1,3-glucanase (GH17 family)
MKPTGFTMSHHKTYLLGAILVTFFSFVLMACGGGGGGGGTIVSTRDSIRPLSAEFTSRKAVAYSPYRTAVDVGGLSGEVIPEANIKQDLDLLVAAGFGLIRIFDSSDKVARQTLNVIRQNNLNIKVMLGMYMQNGDETFNQAEITRGVALAKTYSDIVIAVSVGNENQVYWSFNPIPLSLMVGYTAKVRAQIVQPVTSDDNWAFYAQAPRDMLDVIDFVSMHTYPELDTVFNPNVWDWRQKSIPAASRAAAMMDAAISSAKNEYNMVRSYLDSKNMAAMPVVIGETGWNAENQGSLKYRAHPVNQKMYYERLRAWADASRTGAGPKAIFYFEAFDEPWKKSDDKWGLFNVRREARYVIQNLNPASATWKYEPGTYSDTDAVYYAPPVVSAAITENKYTLYSEAALGASEKRETWFGTVRMDAFGNSALYPEINTSAAPNDGIRSIAASPAPESYGWGLLIQSNPGGAAANLSNFANGNINFSVKTTYAGKIEIGLSTDTDQNGAQEAFLQIQNGQYGYCNTANWCQVSIPVQSFLAANPKLDLSLVLSRFIIADRFAITKNTQISGLPVVAIDGVYWSK